MAQQVTPSTTTSSSTTGKATTTTKFTRVINNFSKLDSYWHFSPVFVAGGYEWRLLVHPDKKTEKGKDMLWVRLRLSDSAKLPSGWSVTVDFSSTLVNQILNKDSINKCTNLQLNEGRIDSGYLYFMYVGSGGYVVNDKVIIETHLSVLDSSSSQDSNKQIEAKMIPLMLATPDTPSVICSSSTTTFTWVINNFTRLKTKWLYSDVFIAGDYQWKLLVYPEGHLSKDLSVYLLVVSPTRLLPINVKFSFKLANQILNNDSFQKRSEQKFREGHISWGFPQFMCLTKLKDRSKGYLVNDKVIIETHLSVLDSSSSHNSNKQIEAKMIPLMLATPDTPSVICSSSTTTFTWVINNFTRLKTKWLYSDVFIAGDYQWKLLVYPEGHLSKDLSVYLLVVSPTRLPPINVEFSFKLVNQILNNDSFQKRSEQQFREGHISWGFPQFMCLTKLKDRSKGYLVKDTVTIEINMSVLHSSSHSASLAPSSRSVLDTSSSCDSEKEIDAKMIPLIPATRDTHSATLLEKSKNISEKLSSLEMAQKSTSASSSKISGSALQQQRKAFKEYLALSSLEAIDQANAFDEIEKIALLLVQHSESSLERAILRDVSSRLANLKDVVPATKASIQNVRAQKATLSGKKADVRSRLYQGKEKLSILEVEFSKLLEEENELEAQVLHLTTQREELLITRNSVALEMEKINEQLAKDLEDSREIRKKDEHAAIEWIQTTEKLARANLSWQLFKQNLELCEKEIVPATRSSIENVRAQKESLSGKKADVRSCLYQGREELSSSEAEFSKLLQEEGELEAQVMHLTTQKEQLFIRKKSVALELEKINEHVAKELEESRDISEEDEYAANNWIQTMRSLCNILIRESNTCPTYSSVADF